MNFWVLILYASTSTSAPNLAMQQFHSQENCEHAVNKAETIPGIIGICVPDETAPTMMPGGDDGDSFLKAVDDVDPRSERVSFTTDTK